MAPGADSTPTPAVARRFAIPGRRALVTGGSMGIGRAIALGLAEAGADVAIQYAPEADAGTGHPSAAQEVIYEIARRGGRTLSLAADFRQAGAARGVIEAVSEGFGGVDILVICASVQARLSLRDVTAAEIARQTAVNLTATVELLQGALPGMRARRWGRVLSIGSVNQTRPDPELGIYAALKAGQHTLMLSLARAAAADGVTLNTLSPGLIATERNRWRRSDPAEWAAIQKAANPMGRAGAPEDIVGAALLLCSNASAFITGADLQVTGGGHL